MPLRWSQSLENEPGCSWGGARAWGRSLGVPGVEPELGGAGGGLGVLRWGQSLREEPGCSWGGARAGGGVWMFLGWSQSLGSPKVRPSLALL